MNLQVAWASKSGERQGYLTQDELPPACDRAIPLVVGEDGNVVTASALGGAVLRVESPWTEDGERLARVAKNGGYDIDWFQAGRSETPPS